MRNAASIDSFEVIFDHFFIHILYTYQPITTSDQRAHQTVTFNGSNSICSITWGSSGWSVPDHWRKFCLKNWRPPTITILVVSFDNFYALCDYQCCKIEILKWYWTMTENVLFCIKWYFSKNTHIRI